MSARLLDITQAQYVMDPCDTPSLSSSIAHVLLNYSPQHAYYYHPKLGGAPREHAKETIDGQRIHKLLLGSGNELSIIQADNYRTKLAQEQRDDALRLNLIPTLQREYDAALKAVEIIQTQLAAQFRIYAKVYDVEQAIEWTDSGTLARCMIDAVDLERGVIRELKTIHCAHPKIAARRVTEFGYDVQAAAQTAALTALRPELAGRIDFMWVFVEIEPPYGVLPARPTGAMRALGEAKWSAACRTWARCLETGVWPGYATEVVSLDPTPWAMAELEDGDAV